ncbi:MAG: NADH-quinone oxidoreductase subunit H, partial [Pseudomonadota bacterium]
GKVARDIRDHDHEDQPHHPAKAQIVAHMGHAPTREQDQSGKDKIHRHQPFDLTEAESELVAGYQVEYSSTPYLLFMIGEYMNIVLMCAMTTLLFFGGWLSPIPGLPDGVLWFVAKVAFFFFMFAMVKAIVPRYRYDQLMRLGWKVFLPMSLGWVVIVAAFAQYGVPGYARWAVGG